MSLETSFVSAGRPPGPEQRGVSEVGFQNKPPWRSCSLELWLRSLCRHGEGCHRSRAEGKHVLRTLVIKGWVVEHLVKRKQRVDVSGKLQACFHNSAALLVRPFTGVFLSR